MARGVQGCERPTITLHTVFVLQADVRGKAVVDPFTATGEAAGCKGPHHRAAPALTVSKGVDLGPCDLREPPSERGVIHMGMGDKNMADMLVWPERSQNGVEMGRVIRARINQAKPLGADKVGVGASEGHGRGVVGENALHIGSEHLGFASRWIKLLQIIHGSSFCLRLWLGLGMFFGWLKHYMPRSLYGRAALILIVPIVGLQLVVSIIFVQRHFDDVTTQMTRSMAVELRLVLAEYRQTGTSASAKALRIDLVEGGAVQERHRWYDFAGLVVRRELQAAIAAVQGVDLPNGRVVYLAVMTERGPVVLTFERLRVSASNPHQLLVYMILVGILMTVIAYIYLRNQLRPIKRLAAAASAFGRGQVIEYRPSGAVEVRAAGNAFLDMRNRIERQIEQRTLMLSGVSHDLRTPLTRMKLGLSLLEDEEREPLERDVQEMQRLVDEFLSFAKGASEGDPEPSEPFALVEEIVHDCQRAGLAVELGEMLGTRDEAVALRRVGVRRAVENLIGNAVRYGTRAVVSVALTERALRIRVEDDGPGIAPDDREEALRPFTRLDAARNQNQGSGVGLGLSIATDVARAHGGVLRLGESSALGGLRADIVIGRG